MIREVGTNIRIHSLSDYMQACRYKDEQYRMQYYSNTELINRYTIVPDSGAETYGIILCSCGCAQRILGLYQKETYGIIYNRNA